MPASPLQYADPTTPRRTRYPLAAMLAGLLSGPLALAFAIIVGDFTSNDAARPLQLGGLAVLVGGAFVFSIVTHNRYSNSSHDRLFSSIGIGAPVVWFLAICGLVIYGFSQMQ